MHAPVTAKDSEKTFSLTHLFSDRRIAAALGLGFTSGIPFLLVYGTQSAWLSEAGVPIATLGLLSELTLAYKFKFVWAPFLDRYDDPFFGRWLGRRRGWVVVSQIAVMLALAGIAFGDPAHWLAWTVAFSLALGFAGARQDVVIDGWRITVAPPNGRRSCRPGRRSDGAWAPLRPGPARFTWRTLSAGALPICAWRPPWRLA